MELSCNKFSVFLDNAIGIWLNALQVSRHEFTVGGGCIHVIGQKIHDWWRRIF